jgi:hypothetical protein
MQGLLRSVFGRVQHFIFNFQNGKQITEDVIKLQLSHSTYVRKAKQAVPLHAMEALGGEEV